jgi:hypothetical protein
MITRLNIAFAVNHVSQLMQSPTSAHWAIVKRILRYLKGSISHGLSIQPSTSLTINAFADSN